MPHVNPEEGREYRKNWKRRRREQDPSYAVSENQKWRDTNPKGYILSRAKGRAKIAKVPFTIGPEDIEIPEFCPVFPEIRLQFHYGRGRPDHIPTLDRIVPHLGYVPGNIAIISMKANRLKSNATPEELRRIADWADQNSPIR